MNENDLIEQFFAECEQHAAECQARLELVQRTLEPTATGAESIITKAETLIRRFEGGAHQNKRQDIAHYLIVQAIGGAHSIVALMRLGREHDASALMRNLAEFADTANDILADAGGSLAQRFIDFKDVELHFVNEKFKGLRQESGIPASAAAEATLGYERFRSKYNITKAKPASWRNPSDPKNATWLRRGAFQPFSRYTHPTYIVKCIHNDRFDVRGVASPLPRQYQGRETILSACGAMLTTLERYVDEFTDAQAFEKNIMRSLHLEFQTYANKLTQETQAAQQTTVRT